MVAMSTDPAGQILFGRPFVNAYPYLYASPFTNAYASPFANAYASIGQTLLAQTGLSCGQWASLDVGVKAAYLAQLDARGYTLAWIRANGYGPYVAPYVDVRAVLID